MTAPSVYSWDLAWGGSIKVVRVYGWRQGQWGHGGTRIRKKKRKTTRP